MAFFESFRQDNGNFISVQWTLKEWLTAKVIGCIAVLFLFGLAAMAWPTFCFLIYFISIEEQRKWIVRTAILACIYFLLDYHFGWLCWIMFRRFETPILDVFAIYDSALLLVFLTLLFFDRMIFENISPNNPVVTDDDRKIVLFIYAIIIGVGAYFLCSQLVPMLISQHVPPIN